MSNTIPECYTNIVGLSRTNCECYDIPESASESQSGLYIDELASLQQIQAITDCEKGADLFEQIEKARDIAITRFQIDTNALILKNYRLKRTTFDGAIGRAIINKGSLNQTIGKWYGIRIFCDNVKGGSLIIKNIGTIFTDTGDIELQIWNNLGELIDTITVNTVASKHTKNTVNIELPLHSKYVDNLEYYIVYQCDGNIAKNNDIKCNCGGFKPVFDISRPYIYSRVSDRNFQWANWIMVGGCSYSQLPNFGEVPQLRTASNDMNGLTFDVELKCNVSEVVCYEALDFESNPLAGAIALAIQYKAASILVGWALSSSNLNYNIFANREQMAEDVKVWDAEYNNMITYISDNVNTSVNDCLICNDIFQMVVRGIAT